MAKKDKRDILQIADWSVLTNEHVFVHGESGSGKSTLLNLISGMLRVKEGQLKVLGQQLNTMTNHGLDRFRAKHIGYVFQQFNLIPYLNAIDNIRLAHYFHPKSTQSTRDNDIKVLLNALNITEHDWLTPAGKLSIGQQQRVAIARALINKPQLIIADEPTSSLDAKNLDAFMTLLMAMVAEHNITLLFVSHDLSLARYFDRQEALSDINQVRA